jgi:hypothetical protein
VHQFATASRRSIRLRQHGNDIMARRYQPL